MNTENEPFMNNDGALTPDKTGIEILGFAEKYEAQASQHIEEFNAFVSETVSALRSMAVLRYDRQLIPKDELDAAADELRLAQRQLAEIRCPKFGAWTITNAVREVAERAAEYHGLAAAKHREWVAAKDKREQEAASILSKAEADYVAARKEAERLLREES